MNIHDIVTAHARFSRRHLLVSSSALALASQSAQSQITFGRAIRVAMIGWEGHPGEITGPLSRLPEVRIIAASGVPPGRLKGARLYPDYRHMLDREKPDIVAVTNNNGERAQAILEAARRGFNIIAEKPLAIHRKDYEQVKQTILDNKIRLGMLLPMRFDSPYRLLRQVVEQGLIGEVGQIGAQKSYVAGDRPPWFLDKRTYGSTILWIGIHMFDLMLFTSGRDFRAVASFAARVGQPELKDMQNVTATLLRLDNGGVATLRMDYFRPATAGSHGDDRLRLAGTRGIVEYQPSLGVVLMNDLGPPEKLTRLPERGSVFVDYLEWLYKGTSPGLTMEEIWRANEVTLAAHEAAEQGRILQI